MLNLMAPKRAAFRCGFAVASLVLYVLAFSMPAVAATKGDMRTRIGYAMQGLQRFQTSHSLDDLHDTVSKLISFLDTPDFAPKNYVRRRRELVFAWAQVLHVIEQSYDPTIDLNNDADLPDICVIPPREPSGRQAPSCAGPSAVQDPASRAAYEAAIDANNKKIVRVNYQARLRNIDEEAMLSLKMDLELFRQAGAPPDNAELDAILRQEGISASRRAKIDAMF